MKERSWAAHPANRVSRERTPAGPEAPAVAGVPGPVGSGRTAGVPR